MTSVSRELWCIGHRGAPTKEPENTETSFERGLADGANGLELDLCVTRDGEVVVWHDWSPSGMTARVRRWGWEPEVAFRPFVPRGRLRRAIRELDLDDVLRSHGYAPKRGRYARIASAPIMTLRDLLKLVTRAPRVKVVFFDIKVPPESVDVVPLLMKRVADLRAEYPHTFHAVFETPYPEVLAAMKAEAPDAHFALDVGPLFGVHPSAEEFSAVKKAILHGIPCATPERPRSSCLRPFATYRRIAHHDVKLRASHNGECPPGAPVERIVGFTINDPREMRELFALGFDGIQSDVPDVLAKVIASLEGDPRAAASAKEATDGTRAGRASRIASPASDARGA